MASLRATLLFSTVDGSRYLSMKEQKVFSMSSCFTLRVAGLIGVIEKKGRWMDGWMQINE